MQIQQLTDLTWPSLHLGQHAFLGTKQALHAVLTWIAAQPSTVSASWSCSCIPGVSSHNVDLQEAEQAAIIARITTFTIDRVLVHLCTGDGSPGGHLQLMQSTTDKAETETRLLAARREQRAAADDRRLRGRFRKGCCIAGRASARVVCSAPSLSLPRLHQRPYRAAAGAYICDSCSNAQALSLTCCWQEVLSTAAKSVSCSSKTSGVQLWLAMLRGISAEAAAHPGCADHMHGGSARQRLLNAVVSIAFAAPCCLEHPPCPLTALPAAG